MKKSLLALLMMATFALTFTGCKKDEEENTPDITENSWSIDGIKYELSNSLLKPSFSGVSLSAFGNGSNLLIKFASKPTTSGTYTLKAITDELTGTQCSVTATVDKDLYYSVGNSGEVVKVTVYGDKVRAEISKVTLESTVEGATKKASLSANILEN